MIKDKIWLNFLKEEKKKIYFSYLLSFLENNNEDIFPPKDDIFKALELTNFKDIKVVILGQDPYHSPNMAMGLSFSTNSKILPPTLKNILKELENDLNIKSTHGDLTSWALQGVLLLNSILTVEKGLANSHKEKGWEIFTKNLIELINEKKSHVVYILWGKSAQNFRSLINENYNLIITSVHPSPLSAHRGFFHSSPFSKTNNYLKIHNKNPINWNI